MHLFVVPLLVVTCAARCSAQVLGVNVKGYAFMTKHTIPAFRRGGRGGSIVNLASISSSRGQAGMTPYNASKGAIMVNSLYRVLFARVRALL